MAKFRMTVIADMPGEQLNPGDSIIVEAQNDTQITGMMVREAVENQLGKRMCSLYHSGHKGKKWSITKI